MKFLVAGQSVRHIACSGARAGFEVAAADSFCDLDLIEAVPATYRIRDPTLHGIDAAGSDVLQIVELLDPDAVILGPGLEELRITSVGVLNNPSSIMEMASDKLRLLNWLEKKGIPSLPTASLSGIKEMAELATSCGQGPNDGLLVIKPRKGAGGIGCRLFNPRVELLADSADAAMVAPSTDDSVDSQGDSRPAVKEDEGLHEGLDCMIVQPFVEGTPASVSVIGDGKAAVAVAVNEQLIGQPWLGCRGFRYCGNISPLSPSIARPNVQEMMIEMAEEIASSLNLVGSNGIDFLITDNGPIVVEVNPRFQGSLDTVEAATGLNLFHAHVESFFNGIEALRGRLGSLGKGELCHSARNAEIRKARMAAGRGVLYAERQMTVKGDLRSDIKEICDVPSPGYRPAIGQPVTSINALGSDRAAVMDRLAYLASKLQGLVSP